MMTKLRHPNIIQTYGACWPKPNLSPFDTSGVTDTTKDGFARCIIMEYAQLGSLNSLLAKDGELVSWFPSNDSFPEREVQRHNKFAWAIQVARGMVYLHSQKQPIMHRDLKCGNVLVATGYTMKLCDFGDSKNFERGASESDSETGTLLFMAPEVVTSSNYTTKVDVYSFAILLIELLVNSRLKVSG